MDHSVRMSQLDFLTNTKDSFTISTLQGEATAAPQRLADSAFCELTMEDDSGALWVRLKAAAPVNFTPTLLADLRGVQEQIGARSGSKPKQAMPRYQVFASRVPGVFSLGGDLAMFRDCIRTGDSHRLRSYARDAVDLVHTNALAYDGSMTTISLVQGQALGGGFEAALSSQVVVAERSARMGLPEVLFNMFPGMGAYQLLCQRLSPVQAEKMILSGKVYTAAELHEMGVVDLLADDGDGENVVRRYIRTHDRQHHAHTAFRRARQAAAPLDLHELYRMVDVWVDTALALPGRDLETIDYLLRAQQRVAARATLEATDTALMMEA